MMGDSVLARAIELASDLNLLEASMVKKNGGNGSASPTEDGNGAQVEADENNHIGDNVSKNAVSSMSDLMEIVKQQQCLITDMAKIIQTNNDPPASAAAVVKQKTGMNDEELQRGEDLTQSSDLHLFVSKMQTKENNDNNNNNNKKKEEKSLMNDHWRVLIVTIGCAIILGLAIGLGAQRNFNKFEETGGGGELCYCHLLFYLISSR